MHGSRIFFRGSTAPPLAARKQSARFFGPQLILQFTEGPNGFITEKTILFQESRGGPTLSNGVQMLISI